MISDTVNLRGMSLSHMGHLTVLMVYSSKFTHVKLKGPNKSNSKQFTKSTPDIELLLNHQSTTRLIFRRKNLPLIYLQHIFCC